MTCISMVTSAFKNCLGLGEVSSEPKEESELTRLTRPVSSYSNRQALKIYDVKPVVDRIPRYPEGFTCCRPMEENPAHKKIRENDDLVFFKKCEWLSETLPLVTTPFLRQAHEEFTFDFKGYTHSAGFFAIKKTELKPWRLVLSEENRRFVLLVDEQKNVGYKIPVKNDFETLGIREDGLGKFSLLCLREDAVWTYKFDAVLSGGATR